MGHICSRFSEIEGIRYHLYRSSKLACGIEIYCRENVYFGQKV